MSKSKKRDNYYIVEVRQKANLSFEIINRWRVIHLYRTKAIFKIQPPDYCGFIKIPNHYFLFNKDKECMEYDIFIDKVINGFYLNLMKEGKSANVRYILLKHSEFQGFKKLLYSLGEAKDIDIIKENYKKSMKEIKHCQMMSQYYNEKITNDMDNKKIYDERYTEYSRQAEKFKEKYKVAFLKEHGRYPTDQEMEI